MSVEKSTVVSRGTTISFFRLMSGILRMIVAPWIASSVKVPSSWVIAEITAEVIPVPDASWPLKSSAADLISART